MLFSQSQLNFSLSSVFCFPCFLVFFVTGCLESFLLLARVEHLRPVSEIVCITTSPTSELFFSSFFHFSIIALSFPCFGLRTWVLGQLLPRKITPQTLTLIENNFPRGQLSGHPGLECYSNMIIKSLFNVGHISVPSLHFITV